MVYIKVLCGIGNFSGDPFISFQPTVPGINPFGTQAWKMTEAKKTPLELRFTIPYVTLYELLVHAVVAFLTF